MIEVKQGELEQLGALLQEHEIEALIASISHKPWTSDSMSSGSTATRWQPHSRESALQGHTL
jgi:hypothetical protein